MKSQAIASVRFSAKCWCRTIRLWTREWFDGAFGFFNLLHTQMIFGRLQTKEILCGSCSAMSLQGRAPGGSAVQARSVRCPVPTPLCSRPSEHQHPSMTTPCQTHTHTHTHTHKPMGLNMGGGWGIMRLSFPESQIHIFSELHGRHTGQRLP